MCLSLTGNDNIFALTNQAPYSIRFDMHDVGGRYNFAVYRHFKISDEKLDYRLSVSNYSGSAGILTFINVQFYNSYYYNRY